MTEAIQGNDDLCTPEWILELVRQMGPILLDPCANRWSTVGAVHSIHKLGDGLSYGWFELARDGVTYVNPPYSKPKPWVIKCAEEEHPRMHIVALLKNDPSTTWFRLAMDTAAVRCDFRKRIRFVGGKHSAGKLASTMFYWGQSPYLFAHLFAPHGDVFVLRTNSGGQHRCASPGPVLSPNATVVEARKVIEQLKRGDTE